MIRLAVPDDVPRMIAMGEAFNTDAGHAERVPFDAKSFERTLAALGNTNRLLVADEGHGAIGMAAVDLGVAVCNYAVRPSREQFWYIQPEHRNGSLGRPLLNALELVAKNCGAHFFDVVAEDGKRSTALARLYRAAGYSPAEIVFRKWL